MLAAGTKLGPYEVLSLLGEGGMGQVFKARDTRLDRLVAIKMLPASLAADAVRRERFEREARTISRLEHPNICPLYDIGEFEGHLYLVMQLLDGETLAQRLERGPVSIQHTLDYGAQIAEALAAAHRADIVHRDLKPGNVMITRTGVRLLDFGLARTALGPNTSQSTVGDHGLSASSLTSAGTILGTMSYMAPEQIEGKQIDTRADVFAFGAVMFEMVTGMRAFDGESPARVISAILRDEPARVSSIVPVTPAALEALIQECLAKSPDDRWQNIADVARQLRHMRGMMSGQRSGALSGPAIAPVIAKPRALFGKNVAWAIAAILAVALAALLVERFTRNAPAAVPLRLHALMLPPDGQYLTNTLALSPDARQLAFVAADVTGRRRLWLRSLESNAAAAVADTDGASDPFWSPDGQQIAFFAGGRLKRVSASGSGVTTVADVANPAGGSWNAAGVIIFAQLDGPMMRIAASGGRAEPLSTFDRTLEETHHLCPTFLPDGQHFVYYINSRERGLYVGELGASTKKRLFDPDPSLPAGAAATPGVYSDSGHLLYVRDRVLMARQFDLGSLSASSESTTIAQTVDYDPPGRAAFTIANGILIYRSRQHRPMAELAWVDRAGKEIGTIASPPGTFRTIALSPDGRLLAVDRRDPQGLPSVWLIDVDRGSSSRLTAAYWAGDPLWTPDGKTLVYSVAVDSPPNLVLRTAIGNAPERRLTQHASEQHHATSFTPEGRQLVYTAISPDTGLDLYLVDTTGDKPAPQRLLQTRANESQGRVSPDGRWIAYVSDDSGQAQVYVSRFPELQGKVAISTNGGSRPLWRGDGKELFFLSGDGRVMAQSITAGAPQLTTEGAVELFRSTLYGDIYLPAGDASRFLIARPVANRDTVPLEIVVNPLR